MHVAGWLHPFSACVIASLSLHQVEVGIRGAVAEIGIHHGKLFFLLYLTTRNDETAVAIDLFRLQHLNIDRSGKGDMATFLRHLQRWSPSREGLRIIESSSLDLTPEDIVQSGRVRLFSIDGAHTIEATLHDLSLASRSVSDEGVVIVDDCFNEYWPEVSAALARYLEESPSLVPWATSPGKVYLCRPAHVAQYTEWIERRFSARVDKRSRLFGFPVTLVGIAPVQRMTLRNLLGRTLLGRALKALRDRVVNSRNSRALGDKGPV